MAVLQFWCKRDIAALINCDVRVLPDLITEDTKRQINFTDSQGVKGKRKKYTLKDVHKILNDVYPFLSEQDRLKMLLPGTFK